MPDTLIRATVKSAPVTAACVSGRDMVERARKIHNLQPVATAALGRTLLGASMMGDALKEEDGAVTLRINGGGPLGTVLAVSDSNGNARGYVGNPDVPLLEKTPGKLDVGAAVGSDGTLTVMKDLGLKDPFSGSVQLVSGEVAEDLARYFAESEQIPTACALGVLVGTDLSVTAAGGYLIQLLPGAEEDVIEKIEAGVAELGPVSAALASGMGPGEILQKVLADFDLEVIEEHPVAYVCPCSRERVKKALLSMGPKELRDMVREQNGAEVTCRFCDAVYNFSADELEDMAASLEAKEKKEED